MQREILRRERWKRFLTQLQPSEAVGDSLAAMIFSWPPDLRRRLAYLLTGRPQRQQRERHHGARRLAEQARADARLADADARSAARRD